ncbi:MAG TPA: YfhO family protein [Myxococcales bacterium]
MVNGRWATSRRLLPALAGLAAFAAVSFRVFDPAVQLFYRDTGRLYYPFKKYVADRLARGELALWDPWTEAGTSLLGQMSPGILHPWTLLYLAFPFDLAFKLNHLLPLLLAGVGLYLLARRLGASTAAATAGALIFGGCGYLVSEAAANLNYVAGPAGIPLALERWLAFLDRPSRGRLAAAAILLALCAYAGEPQSMLMGGLIGAVYAVALALSRRQLQWKTFGAIAAWGGLALAFSAPVALPAAAKLAHSTRKEGLTPYELSKFSVSPLRLPGLFVPSAFDDVPELVETPDDITPFSEYFDGPAFAPSIYLGSAALLLAAFAFLAGRRGRFFLGAGLLLVIASAGEDLGLAFFLRKLIPGYAAFRYAEKQVAFASLLLAVAAALGLDAALARRSRTLVLAGVSAACCAAIGWGSFACTRSAAVREWILERGALHSPRMAELTVHSLAQGLSQEGQMLLLFGAAAALAVVRPRPIGAAMLALACGAAVTVAGSSQFITLPVDYFKVPPPLAHELIHIAGPSPGRWRLYTRPDLDIALPAMDPRRKSAMLLREPLRPHLNSLFDIETVSDYFTFNDPAYIALLERAPRQVFELLTVRFFLVMPKGMTAKEAAELGFTQIHYGMWLRVFPERPRARLLDRVESAPSSEALVARLQQVDSTRVAILSPSDAAAAAGVDGRGGTVRYAHPTAEHITVDVVARGPSVLEVGEHYDQGWRVRVDGKPAPALAVDGAILGTVVPAGRHAVEMRFRPTGFLEGIGIALLALLVTFVTKRGRKLTLSVTAARSDGE